VKSISSIRSLSIFLLLAISSLQAQPEEAGYTAMPLLKIEYSAREAAMAGAAIGMPTRLYGFFSNPSALAWNNKAQAAVSYRFHFLDTWGGALSFGMPIKKIGVVSINIVNLSEGTLESTYETGPDLTPVETGETWRANEFSGSISWARKINKNFALGASFKGAYHYIGSEKEHVSADGFAFDAGLQYRVLKERLITGVIIKNIGALRSSFSEDSDNFPLPTSIGAGISFVPRYVTNLRLALDIEKERGQYLGFEPGVEVALYPRIFFLRIGFPFTTSEIAYVLDKMQGTADDHQKADWRTLCAGIGYNKTVSAVSINFDFGIELHSGTQPSVLVSSLLEF